MIKHRYQITESAKDGERLPDFIHNMKQTIKIKGEFIMTKTFTAEKMMNMVPRFNKEEMLLSEIKPWIDFADDLLGYFTSTFDEARQLLEEYKGRNIELIQKLYNAMDDLLFLHCAVYGKNPDDKKVFLVDNIGCIVDSFYENQYLLIGELKGADIFTAIDNFKKVVVNNEYSLELLKEELEIMFGEEFFGDLLLTDSE